MSPTPFDATRVRGLLFDLDGTLVDSTEDLVASGNSLRAAAGLGPLDSPVVASYIGDGVEALVRRLLERPEGEIAPQIEAFMLHYREHCLDRTRLYPGAAEALRSLAGRGLRLAVVTNKPERVSRRILEGLGVGGLFTSVVGGNTCERKKPHPQPLLRACSDLGLAPEDVLMVGDSRVDVEAGRAAGMATVALLGGIGDQGLLLASSPDVLLEGLGRLEALLEGSGPAQPPREGVPSMPDATAALPERTFHIRFTERIYRLHHGGVMNHAPRAGGVFELVEFPRGAEDGSVLYVGHVPQGGSIAERLQAILEGQGGLPPEKLAAVQERLADLYFDAVLASDCRDEDDWKDLAWALVQAKRPLLNDPAAPNSGRYGSIKVVDLGE